jgi:hypothetical protein
MTKRIAMAILVLLAVVPLVAQTHPIAHVKKVVDEITFSRDVKVGHLVLSAGRYRIECDHTTLSFTNEATGKTMDIPCLGREMDQKAENTELYIVMDADGSNRLTKMYLRGSPVEHFFD